MHKFSGVLLSFLLHFGHSISTGPTTRHCSGKWTTLEPLTQPRQEHGVTAVNNSTIAAVGGVLLVNGTFHTTDLLQLYDISRDEWTTAAPAPVKLNHPSVASISGKLYLLGGLADAPINDTDVTFKWVASPEAHVYDLTTNKWSKLTSMPPGVERGSAIVGTQDEMIYLAGGMTVLQDTYQDAINTVISFNTSSLEWQRLAPSAAEIPRSRQHSTGAVIENVCYVIAGRTFGQMETVKSVFKLDLRNETAGWRYDQHDDLPVSQGGLAGGKIGTKFYAFGGEGDRHTSSGVFPQTEAFDTQSGTWTKLMQMAVPRHGTQAASVGDKIYVPGGGLQQDGKPVKQRDGATTYLNPSNHFDMFSVC